MSKDLKIEIFENNIKSLGFKKKFCSDRSAYWFEKNIKHHDIYLQFIVDVSYCDFLMSCKIGNYIGGKIRLNNYYDDVARFKCDLKTIKEVLRRYK